MGRSLAELLKFVPSEVIEFEFLQLDQKQYGVDLKDPDEINDRQQFSLLNMQMWSSSD